MERYSAYDRFADIYNQYWGHFPDLVMPALERLALQWLTPENTHILDLCCGTGQLAETLGEQGYHITGIDGSDKMLAYARKRAPNATFILADARDFQLEPKFDVVFSLFDSLNHLMSIDDLGLALFNVHAALKPGGVFVFDLNMHEGFEKRWRGSIGLADDTTGVIVFSRYDADERLAWSDITLFTLDDKQQWQRDDITLSQRAYSLYDVEHALETTGFENIQQYDAVSDLKLRGQVGRMFFVGRKPLDE